MTLTGLLNSLVGSLNLIVIFLVALSVATFVWGIANRLMAGGDPKKVRDSYFYLVIGVVTFAVITSLWGILTLAANVLGLDYGFPQFIDTPPADETAAG